MTKEIKTIADKNIQIWFDTLLTKDPIKVSKLYSDEATFLPTLSKDFKRGQQGAIEYFEHFLSKDPIGKVVDDAVQQLSPTAYLHSGMYNFEVGSKADRQIAQARFSMAWEKDSKDMWKIIHHHSSLKPDV
jgi:uncharacterized protein (TIGR02246 family)